MSADELKKALEALDKKHSAPDHKPFREKTYSYSFMSNEADFSGTIKNVQESFSSTQVPSNKTAVAVIIGESNICSMLSTLAGNIDLVIFADFDPNIIQHNNFLLECLRTADNRPDFEALYLSDRNPIINKGFKTGILDLNPTNNSPVRRDVEIDAALSRQLFEGKKARLGDSCFLASEERYQQAKTALDQITFMDMPIDFFEDAAKIKEIKAALDSRQALVRLVNITNLHHFSGPVSILSGDQGAALDKRLSTNLLQLTLSHPTGIMYSKTKPTEDDTGLFGNFSPTVGNYLQDISKERKRLNRSKAQDRKICKAKAKKIAEMVSARKYPYLKALKVLQTIEKRNLTADQVLKVLESIKGRKLPYNKLIALLSKKKSRKFPEERHSTPQPAADKATTAAILTSLGAATGNRNNSKTLPERETSNDLCPEAEPAAINALSKLAPLTSVSDLTTTATRQAPGI